MFSNICIQDSVMQYGDYFFAASDDKPTMTAKNGKPLGNSKGFSWVLKQSLSLLIKISLV